MVMAGFRSTRELGDLIHVLKEHCAPEEYDRLKLAIAAAITKVFEATTDPAFAAHPSLGAEVDEQITKYGRFV